MHSSLEKSEHYVVNILGINIAHVPSWALNYQFTAFRIFSPGKLQSAAMGIDAGFDMYPPLSKGLVDRQNWGRFIDFTKEHYKDDTQVEIKPNYINIKAGEHPKLPFEGHKFLRFSSKVSGSTAADTKVDSYIDTVTRIAQTRFGSRIRCWHEGADEFGAYNWSEVNESLRSYEQMNLRLRPAFAQLLSGTDPIEELGIAPFEIKHILGKGKGLVARFNISKGTRIIFVCQMLTINWNSAEEHETIHAIRSIERGTEITISYDHGGTSSERQALLKESFGFSCTCSGCTLPPSSLQASDNRRTQIQNLDEAIGDPFRMMSNPQESLRDCYSLIQVLDQEFDGCAGALIARLYYDAFQISIAHGDQARASIFAERAYKARVICEGEDSPETLRVKSLALKPAVHSSFEAYSRKWKRTRDSVPKGLDTVEFNK
ncbi:hypothetical protein G7Y89_g13638 [Cudoniella acicularis]|uniref:SET domain-containing protein n=1 Tax=Cudoniella acicularis TaxID=354080 RepID=A0A8H4R963_9HELO|nr:hypothetical protein G7Y89_g13638 [Cudoniella acicularis]